MVSMKVEKATAKGKKYKAIFFDDKGKKIKTSQFGAQGYEDYTQHGDKQEEPNIEIVIKVIYPRQHICRPPTFLFIYFGAIQHLYKQILIVIRKDLS